MGDAEVKTMNYYIINDGWCDSNELYHYGIKGMKWGVRRYQNPDGSMTEKGIKRYNQISAREVSASKGRHGKKVLDKYEKLKTSEQKRADKQRDDAHRRLNQSRKDRKLDDFDFLDEVARPGSKLGKLYNSSLNAELTRAKAYAGAKWYNKYNRELVRAIDKDNRELGYY